MYTVYVIHGLPIVIIQAPHILENWAALRCHKAFSQKKIQSTSLFWPPERSEKGQGQNERAYAHLHYIS